MIKRELIDNQIRELRKEISKGTRNVLHEFPIEVYINDIKSYPELYSYDYISPKLSNFLENMITIT